MHELGLMRSLRDTVIERAAIDRFTRVAELVLEVGALCNVEPEALRFCFEIVMKGTPAEDASLRIEPVPADAWCGPCARGFALTSRLAPCPWCGGWDLRVENGDELRLVELEVE